MEQLCILLLGFTQGYKIPQPHGPEKSENRVWADTPKVRRGLTFQTSFSKNLFWIMRIHRCGIVMKHCACARK